MRVTEKSEACCGAPHAIKPVMSAPEAACCSPESELREAASACCGAQVDAPLSKATTAGGRRLDIDFLYLDLSVCERCQDTESALERSLEEVARVLESTGVEVEFKRTHITSEEQAAALGFLVSPTIRVNGRDIQMEFRESACETCGTLCECEGGVSCREWQYQGQWYTAPPKGLIIEAVLKEVYGGTVEGRHEPQKPAEAPDNLKRFFSGLVKPEVAHRS